MRRNVTILCGLALFSAASLARAERPSVVLLTVDTLRADRLGAYGHTPAGEGGSITPNIDRLARRGRLHTDASVQVPITLPSHCSILTGLDPVAHGVRNNGGPGLAPGRTTLAEILHEAGYSTGAFVGAFPLDRSFGLGRGFEVYDDRMPAPDRGRFLFAERPGPEVLAAALPWLRGRHGPFFLWLHLYDPHAPYQPPAPFDRLAAPYDGEVALVDHIVGDLEAELRLLGRPVLLVLTADHGEAFGEHGETTHGVFLYQSTLHVPLLVVLPSGPGRVEGAPVQSLDIVPTVLDAVGLPARSDLPGRSLLQPAGTGRGFLLESLASLLDYGWHELAGLRQGRWKLIRAPRPELYDLQADPGELRNLHGPEAPAGLGSELDALLAERSAAPSATLSAPPPDAPDPEQAAALASLGYVSAGPAAVSGTARPDPKDRLETLQAFGRAALEPPERAIPILQDILRREGDNPLARQRLGWLFYFSGQLGPAAEQFRQLLETGATATEILLALADCQARNGQRELAIQTMRSHARSADRPAYVYLNLGRHLLHAGRRAEAEAAWRAGLEIEPGLTEIRQALGLD